MQMLEPLVGAIHELPLPRVLAFNSATPNSQPLQVVALFTPPSNSDSEID
jgi:hypothetical protein